MKSNYSKKPTLNKYIHIDKVKKNIHEILIDDDNMCFVITHLFDYMMTKQLYGCCHALSSVLYVALSELGYYPELFIGECKCKYEKPFDHSWITINNKIIDLAIYMPITMNCNSLTGPVILDIDAVSMKKCDTDYGIYTGLPMDSDTTAIMNHNFSDYMSKFPYEKNGLWTVLKMILPNSEDVDIEVLKEKYKDTERIFIR